MKNHRDSRLFFVLALGAIYLLCAARMWGQDGMCPAIPCDPLRPEQGGCMLPSGECQISYDSIPTSTSPEPPEDKLSYILRILRTLPDDPEPVRLNSNWCN